MLNHIDVMVRLRGHFGTQSTRANDKTTPSLSTGKTFRYDGD